MLVRYSVENFLSFYKKRDFNMIAGSTRNLPGHIYEKKGIRLLKGSLIYGPNGSGKSNFIKSIEFAKSCILEGIESLNTSGKNYRIVENSDKEKTEFEFEILIDEKIYAYGFTVNLIKKEILEEWLYEVGAKEDKLIFERKGLEVKESIYLEVEDRIRYDVWLENLESNKLLITLLNENKSLGSKNYSFNKIKKWFEENLIIITPNSRQYINEFFYNLPTLKNYLKFFDTGISNITLKNRNLLELEIPEGLEIKISNDVAQALKDGGEMKESEGIFAYINGINYRIISQENETIAQEMLFKHENCEREFSIKEESDGTQRVLELIPLLEKIKKPDTIVLIDEIERSLHPVLVKALLENLYLNVKNTESQFIISTHESRLIDLDEIRRDEIWFTERDEEEGTKFYSLDEFNIRQDYKADKAYLLGRFGGIPEILNLIDTSDMNG